MIKEYKNLKRSHLPKPSIEELELDGKDFNIEKAIDIYQEFGALVVRGLMNDYIEEIKKDIDFFLNQSIAQLPNATKNEIGWHTENGSLFIPAPESFEKKQQIMTLCLSYHNSSAFLHSAMDTKVLDFAEQILGPNIEAMGKGQSLVKEAHGGHPKMLHQDSAYFMHKYQGPLCQLNYTVKTDDTRGALRIVPASHRLGILKHIDSFSHLALDPSEWSWEDSISVSGNAGDAIFFNYHTIHGSKENFSNANRPVFITRFRNSKDYITSSGATLESISKSQENTLEVKPKEEENIMLRGRRE